MSCGLVLRALLVIPSFRQHYSLVLAAPFPHSSSFHPLFQQCYSLVLLVLIRRSIGTNPSLEQHCSLIPSAASLHSIYIPAVLFPHSISNFPLVAVALFPRSVSNFFPHSSSSIIPLVPAVIFAHSSSITM